MKKTGLNVKDYTDFKGFLEGLKNIKHITLRDGNLINIVQFIDHHSQEPCYVLNSANVTKENIRYHERKDYMLITDVNTIIRVKTMSYGSKNMYLEVTHMGNGAEHGSFLINPKFLLLAMGINVDEFQLQMEGYEN
jgi:hypothetical protein